MMRKIWKFELGQEFAHKISLPRGAQIVEVAFQGDALCMWALCNMNAETEERVFRIYGTGHELPNHGIRHLKTWQNGALVWHIFELFDSEIPDDLPEERHVDYRMLLRDGFAPVPFDPPTDKHAWRLPESLRDADLGYDQLVALERLREHGYGNLVLHD